jgi:fumarylacetoacetate (FAA) hydrolase
MRLATRGNGERDGRLHWVSRDLQRWQPVPGVLTLQALLDDWAALAPALATGYEGFNAGAEGEAFQVSEALSPLPRAYQWADGSAYVNHVELVRRARGAELPASFWEDPLMYQGGSDGFLAPTAPIPLVDPAWGLDLEAEIAVVTDEVPMGVPVAAAGRHIRLLMLVNDVSLRGLIPGELAKGFGFFQSKPASAFSPLALTPEELGTAWDGARLHGALHSELNGAPLGSPDAGVDMHFSFPQLIAHAARTRSLGAGSIIGSGTVSNRDADGGPGRPVADGGLGYSCLAEQRVVETLLHGAPRTSFLRHGDRVRIEMRDASGASLFGAIDQQVVPFAEPGGER